MAVWEKSQSASRETITCKGPEAGVGVASLFEQSGDPCGWSINNMEKRGHTGFYKEQGTRKGEVKTH